MNSQTVKCCPLSTAKKDLLKARTMVSLATSEHVGYSPN